MAAGFDISASASSGATADSGKFGPINITTGGGKQSVTLYIVLGVVALVGLVVWLKRK